MSRLIELSLVTLSLTIAMLIDLAYSADLNKNELRISVLSTVQVIKDRPILLADLATVDGGSPASNLSLYQTTIFPRVDFLGKTGTLPGIEVGRAIRAALDASVGSELRVILPEAIELNAAETILPPQRVEALIRAELLAQCGECRVTLRDIKLPSLKESQAGSEDFQLNLSSGLKPGSFMVSAVSVASGQKLWITGFATVEKLALVSKRMIPLGDRISIEDFEQKWVDTTFAKDGLVSAASLAGMIAARSISLNQPLYRKDVRLSYAIKKGQVVRAFSGKGDLEVSRELIAEQSGYVGELIRLRAAETKKTIMGRVLDSEKARVE